MEKMTRKRLYPSAVRLHVDVQFDRFLSQDHFPQYAMVQNNNCMACKVSLPSHTVAIDNLHVGGTFLRVPERSIPRQSGDLVSAPFESTYPLMECGESESTPRQSTLVDTRHRLPVPPERQEPVVRRHAFRQLWES